MKELIFGSTAIKHYFPDFRDPQDLDIMSPEPLMTEERQHYWVSTFKELVNRNKSEKYLDPDFLYTVKLSHSGWNIHWEKTIFDILFLKSKGCKADKELYKKLVKDWIKIHGVKWAQLKGKDSTTFFEDAVPRKYVHDAIHEVVAINEKPLYERLLSTGVECSNGGFEGMSHEDKINLVKEEVWVTALERYLIPNDFKFSSTAAYQKALKKLATTMSSGNFKFFILDNIGELMQCRDKTYIGKFKAAEAAGLIPLA